MNKFLVIGNPIEHSLSPKLHNYWIKNNGLNAVYDKKKLEINELEKIIIDIREKKLKGINVTVPFKQAIIPFLDKLTLEARSTHSVNTVYIDQNRVVGHNTDIEGFKKAIEKINFNLSKKTVLILGAGGVVPSLIFALRKMNVSKIIITNRTREKAEKLKYLFKNTKILEWGKLIPSDMIINATSLGLKKEDNLELDFSNLGKNKFFYDIIYNPPETNFLKKGKELGHKTENGKLMFVYQALGAFNLWHKSKIKIDDHAINLLNK
tara:strand:+ start:267 stop:1061 length:795 start_codon:yes stop_codon:yes gene_type:complete